MQKRNLIQISLCVLLLFLMTNNLAFADRGVIPMRPITAKENIDVFDAGQKAIICWEDGEELLILSTDKYASQDTKVLEFLPLPSKPSRVEKADESCFKGIAGLIENHRPKIVYSENGRSAKKAMSADNAPRAEAEPAVKIVFHKQVGAHDITIGLVERMDGFAHWVKKFMTDQGMQYREEDLKNLQPIVEDYLKRGYRFFVFDVVDLTKEKKSIEPVLYQFKSKNIYFPLLVTTLAKGETNVALYLFTHFKTDIWGTRTGFVSGFYSLNGKVLYNSPVKFLASYLEVAAISKDIDKFFGLSRDSSIPDNRAMRVMVKERPLWFSTAKFKGNTEKLIHDFIIKPAPDTLPDAGLKSIQGPPSR